MVLLKLTVVMKSKSKIIFVNVNVLLFSFFFDRYTPLQRCLSRLPGGASRWPPFWPERLTAKPLRLPPTLFVEELFHNDTKYWSDVVSNVYLGGLGINWTIVRNVMDMTASHGG